MKTKAKFILKNELLKKDINYVQLAELMVKKGYSETPDTIRTKVHRGAFSFAFVLEVFDALDLEIKISAS